MNSRTLFSIAESELEMPSDGSLPGYESSVLSQARAAHVLQLGTGWQALHQAYGAAVEFLVSGGERVAWLDEGNRSQGRYFPAAMVAELVTSLDRTSRPSARLVELREFLRASAAQNRGIVVHALELTSS